MATKTTKGTKTTRNYRDYPEDRYTIGKIELLDDGSGNKPAAKKAKGTTKSSKK